MGATRLRSRSTASAWAPYDAALRRASEELDALQALEAHLVQVVAELAEGIHGPEGMPPRAIEPAEDPEGWSADRPVRLVAEFSLTAQDRVEDWLASRRPVRSDEQPLEGWSDASVRALEAALRSRDAARRLLTAPHPAPRRRSAPSIARPRVPAAARVPLRVAVAATVGVLVAVQVLGVGRPTVEGDLAVDAAAPVAPADAAVDPAAATPPAPSRTPAPTSPPAPEPVPTPSVQQPARMAAPVALRVPAIEVDAAVVIVGLEPDGAMEIPSDVRTVGWYEPFPGVGVSPGEPGTAVIAGHVDSRTQGRGAFWSLRDLRPGDIIEIDHEDGTSTRWRIDEVVRYPKTDIPIEEIFTFEGDERLALITCGGEFDRSLGAYLDNYVVTASPLAAVGGGQLLPTAP